MTRQLREPPPAFLFFGVFTGFEAALDRIREAVVRDFGPLHPGGESPVWPFPETETYRPTMGGGLRRRFFVVERLWPEDGLAAVKLRAMEMEDALRDEGTFPVERPVNVDPGLLDERRIILATTKPQPHRLYRGGGIWEEVTLVYQHGGYESLPWTYPDFRAPTYHPFLSEMRRDLLARRRG